MNESEVRLLDERTYFVGDRAAASQIVMFLISGAITFLIELADISEGFISYFWWICIAFPLAGLIILVIFTERLYFDYHWHNTFALLLMMWAPLVVYLGVLFDKIWAGDYNAVWLSLFLSLIVGGGYFLAKYLRIRRHQTNPLKVGAIFSVIIIFWTVFLGSFMYSSALEDAKLSPFDIFGIHNCQPCILSVYIIITGIGAVISMGFYYYMFHCLYDPKGMDVKEDPPNELYLKVMRISWILCFISWLLLLILFPPIAAGGKGKKRGSVRVRPRPRRTVYLTTRHYGKKKKKKHPPEKVEEEWAEHELGKYDQV
ncbi:MAG: hypothetical protein HWN65_08025 [Candidatus Helarchaeota archaeon]|nr:hypothetical protein [Candidatus Helarchaeota archaeon]